MAFKELPEAKPELPIKRRKFIDIEVSGSVISNGKIIVGPTNNSITLDSSTDSYRIVDAATDIYADSVIEFDQAWSVAGITTNAAIAAYDGTSLANPYLFVAGPHRGTDISDAARLSVGIREGTFETLAFLIADEVHLGVAATATTVSGTLVVDGATTLTGGITQEAWTAPTLLNSWVDFGGVFQDARYRKDASGVVHIQGMIKTGTTTAGTTVFTLPAGYRPAASQTFLTPSSTGMARTDVTATGDVNTQTGWSATWTAIEIMFAT